MIKQVNEWEYDISRMLESSYAELVNVILIVTFCMSSSIPRIYSLTESQYELFERCLMFDGLFGIFVRIPVALISYYCGFGIFGFGMASGIDFLIRGIYFKICSIKGLRENNGRECDEDGKYRITSIGGRACR